MSLAGPFLLDPRALVSVRFCTTEQIQNPASWPGVISSRPGSNFWWCDGEPYDPETAEMTLRELDDVRFEFEDEADERRQMEASDELASLADLS